MFLVRQFSEQIAKEIAQWKYDGEYAIYNCLSWKEMVEQNWGMTNLLKRELEFKAVVDEKDTLVGFFRLVKQEQYFMLGLGLRPDLCGLGFGDSLLKLIQDYMDQNSPDMNLRLEVRDFNTRALKCYQKAGFKILDSYKRQTSTGNSEFYLLEYRTKQKKEVML